MQTIGNYLQIWFVPKSEQEFSLLRGIQGVQSLDEQLHSLEMKTQSLRMKVFSMPW